jgi:hypothetical protein
MQKSCESGSATHIGPESCGAARKRGVEALWFHEIAPAAPNIVGYAVAYFAEVGGADNTRTGK